MSLYFKYRLNAFSFTNKSFSYRLSYSTLSSPLVSLSKSWSLKFYWTKFYIKILVLEITSRKIFLIFHFIKYDIAIIKQTFNNILKNLHHQLAFEILNEVSQSNIFHVFFLQIWSFKVNSILIISGPAFCSVNSISICSFSSSFFSEQLLIIWLKFWQLEDQ